MAALAEAVQRQTKIEPIEPLPQPHLSDVSTPSLSIEFANVADAAAIRGLIRRGSLDTLRNQGFSEGQAYTHVTGLYEEKEKQNIRIVQQRIKNENYDERIVDQLMLVAKSASEIKGCVWPHIGADGVKWLGGLYVKAGSRDEGIGSLLVTEVLDLFDYKETSLVVTEVNEGAQRLYKRFGFKVVKELTQDYPEKDFALPIPKLLMTRPAGPLDLLH